MIDVILRHVAEVKGAYLEALRKMGVGNLDPRLMGKVDALSEVERFLHTLKAFSEDRRNEEGETP